MNNQQTREVEHTYSSEILSDLIVDCIQDIKGKGIVKLDLRHLDDRPADYFIICEGESSVQMRSIANNVAKRVKTEMSMPANHTEGTSDSMWVLVDFFDVVVHIFHPEARSYYQIEELWNDAHSFEYEDI